LDRNEIISRHVSKRRHTEDRKALVTDILNVASRTNQLLNERTPALLKQCDM
jgi:hypothetical protein